jgi:PAS domain S-box-containing protein
MVNAQAERMFGYARAEMLGNAVEMLVPERFRRRHTGLRGSFSSGPRLRPMEEGRDLYGLRADGSEFPLAIGLNPIATEAGTMVLSTIIDISERQRLEDRFRQAVEASPNAMVMTNAEARIEMVNTQAELMFGYTREELLGRPIEMLVPERFREHHPELRAVFVADPSPRPMGAGRDLFGLRKDGSEFPVEIGLNPMQTGDGTKILAAIVDISDRKQKEDRIVSALHEKEILLREIHHRVKNNLQIVHSLLELQSARIPDPVARDMLRVSQARVHSMALIHQTLYSSNDFATVDFHRFLDSLVPVLIASYGVDTNRISVRIDVDPVQLPIDAAVPCGLVVNELITNAFKHAFGYRDHGEITVALTWLTANEVLLSVSDDGIGIPDHINISGTDTLGLQLVGLLAEQLGGVVTIQRSDPTRFALKFSVKR